MKLTWTSSQIVGGDLNTDPKISQFVLDMEREEKSNSTQSNAVVKRVLEEFDKTY